MQRKDPYSYEELASLPNVHPLKQQLYLSKHEWTKESLTNPFPSFSSQG